MNSRRWMLLGAFATLLVLYAVFFTEWFRPAPIGIASQVRFAIQPPRFGRPVKQVTVAGIPVATNRPPPPPDALERIGKPDKGAIDPAPGGVANVTFTLDSIYRLTRVRVEDIPADGTPPRVLWEIEGKSRPTKSLLYGRTPDGMKPVGTSTNAEFLTAGAPYRLLLEAGRRRGTNRFTTAIMPRQQ